MASFLFFLSFFSLCEKNHLQHCLLLEARANQEKEKEIVPPFWFSFLSVRFSCVRFLSLWKLSSLGRFCSSSSSFNDAHLWCVMKMLRGDEQQGENENPAHTGRWSGANQRRPHAVSPLFYYHAYSRRAQPFFPISLSLSLSSFPPLLSLSLWWWA